MKPAGLRFVWRPGCAAGQGGGGTRPGGEGEEVGAQQVTGVEPQTFIGELDGRGLRVDQSSRP